MQNGRYSVAVDVSGRNSPGFRPAFEYPHEGQTFIEGREGSRFKLRFRNQSPSRVLVVVAVDGLSVMNGEQATGDNSNGYVVGAYQEVTIDGWRRSNDEVAEFVFSGKEESYTAQMGNSSVNAGVIGIRVYEEKPKPKLRGLLDLEQGRGLSFGDTRGGGHSFGGNTKGIGTRSASVDVNDMGTAYGNRAESKVRTVDFEAKDEVAGTLVIRYASKKALEARGIRVTDGQVAFAEPDPFPADKGCKAPPGWRG